MIVGNDIASFQGDVDFDTYKNNSNFVIIKASEGMGFTDPKFSRNQSESRRVGLLRGYYHFARPDLGNSAQAEAGWFLKVIGTLQEGEVLCLDYEVSWTGDKVGWCKDFLSSVFNLVKCKPLIYLNQSLISGNDWTPVVNEGYGLWVAAYTGSPTNNNFVTGAWPSAVMQQWTSSQTVPGISGNVDGDAFFGDAIAFTKYGFHNPSSPSSSVSPSSSSSASSSPSSSVSPSPSPSSCEETLQQIHDIIWGPGWWYRWPKIRTLLPK